MIIIFNCKQSSASYWHLNHKMSIPVPVAAIEPSDVNLNTGPHFIDRVKLWQSKLSVMESVIEDWISPKSAMRGFQM